MVIEFTRVLPLPMADSLCMTFTNQEILLGGIPFYVVSMSVTISQKSCFTHGKPYILAREILPRFVSIL